MQEDSISVEVVEKVAAREGVEPTELAPPLYEVISPEALDSLFRADAPRASGVVEFTYKGYTVTVDQSGAVEVTPRAGTAANPHRVDAPVSD